MQGTSGAYIDPAGAGGLLLAVLLVGELGVLHLAQELEVGVLQHLRPLLRGDAFREFRQRFPEPPKNAGGLNDGSP